MEIQVGEYVRTDKGLIDKIIGFNGALILFEKDSMCQYTDVNDIAKHSFNIIDLIEVGDYVNGELVIGTAKNNFETLYICLKGIKTIHTSDDIKSIVTKQAFESIKYEV